MPETPDPMTPLPVFPQTYQWPPLIQNILSYGKRPQQRDVLLLGALTVIGATLSTFVRFLYNKVWFGPALQCFVVAPSASGKGVPSWVRMIAEPLYLHAAHILSFMDSVQMVSSGSADRDVLLASMPDEFSRQEFLDKARGNKIPVSTADTWLKRLKAQGGIVAVRRGVYQKAAL